MQLGRRTVCSQSHLSLLAKLRKLLWAAFENENLDFKFSFQSLYQLDKACFGKAISFKWVLLHSCRDKLVHRPSDLYTHRDLLTFVCCAFQNLLHQTQRLWICPPTWMRLRQMGLQFYSTLLKPTPTLTRSGRQTEKRLLLPWWWTWQKPLEHYHQLHKSGACRQAKKHHSRNVERNRGSALVKMRKSAECVVTKH